MAGISKGVSDQMRQKLNYEGYQAKEWVQSLIQEKGLMQIDAAKMLGVTTKTVSFWVTGVTFPNPSVAKSLVLAVAPHYSLENERKKFIDEQIAIYESIRESYLKAKRGR